MDPLITSWQIVRESWNVLKADKALLLYPIFSVISILVFIAAFLFAALYFLAIQYGHSSVLSFIQYIFIVSDEDVFFWVTNNYFAILLSLTGVFFLILLVMYCISNFFNAALMSSAYAHLTGKDHHFSKGVHFAEQHFGRIMLWSGMAVFTSSIFDLSKRRGSIRMSFFSVASDFPSRHLLFFILPILIFKKMSIKDSIVHSGILFKKKWGEQVTSNIYISLIFVLLFSLGVLFLMLIPSVLIGEHVILTSLLLLAIYGILLFCLSTATNTIFTTALYIYATTSKVPRAFSKDHVKHAFIPKKGWLATTLQYSASRPSRS